MTKLTADEVIEIWKIAKARAAGYKIDYSRTKEETSEALEDLNDLKEAEQGDQIPPEEKYD